MFLLLLLLGTTLAAATAALEDGCYRLEDVKGQYLQPRVIPVLYPGRLYSPGFERNGSYPDAIVCSYQLQAPEGMHVRLQFNEVDISVTDACAADSLVIHDFDDYGRALPTTLKLCGSKRPLDLVSTNYAIQLIFSADSFDSARGFNITYSPQTSPRVCASGLQQCRNRKCVPPSTLCNGNDDCGDGTDEEHCGVPLESVECGVSEVPVARGGGDRIVGGEAAAEGSWPWMADLQVAMIEPNGHVCGGSLINAQWVLTAAHCVMEPMVRYPEGWRIHLGNFRKFEKDEYEQIRYVERIVVYDDIPSNVFELYGEFEMKHDMALLKLNAPVRFTKHVRPVCLGTSDVILNVTSNCYHSGWGATRGTGYSHVLKQARHPVQDDALCMRQFYQEFIPETMICAGSMADKNGACHGDSGGPLHCERGGVWSVFGVASFVTDVNFIHGLCGMKETPTVFNKVAPKIQWINKMINKYS